MTNEIYQYRFLRSTWGMAIDIACEIKLVSEITADMDIHQVTDDLWLELGHTHQKGAYDMAFIYYLSEGLRLVAEALLKVIGKTAIVVVKYVNYPPTDFQDEGLAYAIASWVIQKHDLEVELPEVTFDKEVGRYVFPHINEYLPRSDGLSPRGSE